MKEVKKVAVKTSDLFKAVEYHCGCFAGSDRPIPAVVFRQRCVTHGSPIKFFIKEKKP